MGPLKVDSYFVDQMAHQHCHCGVSTVVFPRTYYIPSKVGRGVLPLLQITFCGLRGKILHLSTLKQTNLDGKAVLYISSSMYMIDLNFRTFKEHSRETLKTVPDCDKYSETLHRCSHVFPNSPLNSPGPCESSTTANAWHEIKQRTVRRGTP